MSGFLSVATAAFACSIILSAGTQQPVQSVLSAMMGIHLVIAVFEGIITVCVLRLAESLKSNFCILGLAVTAGVAGVWICYGVGKRILLMGAGTACFISKTKNN